MSLYQQLPDEKPAIGTAPMQDTLKGKMRMLFACMVWAIMMLCGNFVSEGRAAQGAFSYDQEQAAFNPDATAPGTPPDLSDIPTPETACKTTGGYTKLFVKCLKSTIIYAAYQVLGQVSFYMARTVAICMMLAVALWGGMVITGKTKHVVKEGFTLFLKIGLVSLLTWDFGLGFGPSGKGGLFPMTLDVMDDLLNMVANYVHFSPTLDSLDCSQMPDYATDQSAANAQWQVWDMVDCTLDELTGGIFSNDNPADNVSGGIYQGVGNPTSGVADGTLASGIIGFLIACFFSQSPGILIAVMGVVLIGLLLFAIVRSIYIFVTAYICFALMVLISPFFIPLWLFASTKGYAEKHLKLAVGFIPIPLFSVAYITWMMVGIDTILYTGTPSASMPSLYGAISGNNVGGDGDDVGPGEDDIGDWLKDTGAVGSKPGGVGGESINTDPKRLMKLMKKNGVEVDTGTADQVPALIEKTSNDLRNQVLNFPGFNVGADVPVVDWGKLAVAAGDDEVGDDPNNPDPTHYLGTVLMAFIMALLVTYVFYSLLDYLPFIGSGIASELLSMGPLGVGNFGPPGEQAAKGIKDQMASGFGLGK